VIYTKYNNNNTSYSIKQLYCGNRQEKEVFWDIHGNSHSNLKHYVRHQKLHTSLWGQNKTITASTGNEVKEN
jgi:hypothetical protein